MPFVSVRDLQMYYEIRGTGPDNESETLMGLKYKSSFWRCLMVFVLLSGKDSLWSPP